MENNLEELDLSGLVKFLEPIVKQSLNGIEGALNNPLSSKEVDSLKELMVQLKEEVSSFGDTFSPDIRGQIIELNHKLHDITPIDI
jgi:hypothetical protein